MNDPILDAFLRHQADEGRALAEESDILTLTPLGPEPFRFYQATFRCRGLVREPSGEVCVAERFDVIIAFGAEYLRRVAPYQVVRWAGPQNVFHPNISDRAPVICLGRLTPGTPLVDLLYQCYEIVSFQRVTMREDDALNHAACVWCREHLDRLPVDPRPLKRRRIALDVTLREGAGT